MLPLLLYAAQAKEDLARLNLKLIGVDATALEQARQLLAANHKTARLEAQIKDVQTVGLTGGRESKCARTHSQVACVAIHVAFTQASCSMVLHMNGKPYSSSAHRRLLGVHMTRLIVVMVICLTSSITSEHSTDTLCRARHSVSAVCCDATFCQWHPSVTNARMACRRRAAIRAERGTQQGNGRGSTSDPG